MGDRTATSARQSQRAQRPRQAASRASRRQTGHRGPRRRRGAQGRSPGRRRQSTQRRQKGNALRTPPAWQATARRDTRSRRQRADRCLDAARPAPAPPAGVRIRSRDRHWRRYRDRCRARRNPLLTKSRRLDHRPGDRARLGDPQRDPLVLTPAMKRPRAQLAAARACGQIRV